MGCKTLALAFLALFAYSHALQVLSATYQYAETDLFEKRQAWLVYEIQFDSQPYFINHGQIQSFASYTDFDMTTASLSGLLNCPSTHVNHCSGGKDVGILALPPTASPMQAVLKGVSAALIQEFSGDANTFNWTFNTNNFPTINTRPNYWTGVAMLWEQDTKTEQQKVCLPLDLISSCPLVILPPIVIPNEEFNFTGICDSNGENCLNFTTVPTTPKAPQCSISALSVARDSFLTALDFNPLSINNVGQLVINALEYQARSLDAAILACRDLILSLVNLGPTSVTSVTDVCHKPLWTMNGINFDYLGDPCCSGFADYYGCCQPRPVTYERNNIVGVDIPRLLQCNFPNETAYALLDVYNIISHIDDICGAEDGWHDKNVWFKETFGPVEFCLREVFDKSCESDQNCPSNLCVKGKCIPPFENPSTTLTECLANNLDRVSRRFWMNQWGLTANSTSQDFISAFQANVYEPTCIGPSSYDNPPTTQSACEAIENCNWNPELSQVDCLKDGPIDFCGICLTSKICWSLTVPSFCVIPGNSSDCTATFVPDINACIDLTLNQSSCVGYWFDGIYNTPQKCAEGLCLGSPLGTTGAECAAKQYCTRPCPSCSSQVFPEGACFVPSLEANCLQNGGTFYRGVCRLAITESECDLINGGQFKTCQSKLNALCNVGIDSELLGCFIDQAAACQTQEECEAQGRCNDEFIGSISNPSSACFRFYKVNFNGEPTCNFGDLSEWYDVKAGCINPLLTEQQCSLVGDTLWVSRGFTENDCKSYELCREPTRGTFTYKNSTDCAACGGTYGPIFTWTSGVWESGEVVTLNWKTRSYGQSNAWGLGLAFNDNTWVKLINILLQPIGAKMAYRAKNSGFCRYAAYLYALEVVADGCGNAKRTTERALGSDVQIGVFKAWSGLPQSFDAGAAIVSFNADTVKTSDSVDITLFRSLASRLEVPFNKRSVMEQAMMNHEKRQTIAIELVLPVTNANGIEVGQVASDGFSVTFSPAIDGNFSLCLLKRSDVPADSCFNVLDFASGSPLVPMGATITWQDADSVCATFTNADAGKALYIINRVANWQSLTVNPCQSATSAGTSGGVTGQATTTSAGTSGQESSSSIVIPSLIMAVVALISLFMF